MMTGQKIGSKILNRRLSISAMSTFAWSFESDLALWDNLGVASAGLLEGKLGDNTTSKLEALKDAGIGVSTFITQCFDLAAPETWEGTRQQHRRAIDHVAFCHGQSIYFTPGRTTGLSWAEDLERLSQAVAPTIAYGHTRGVKVAIEPSLRTSVSFINTLRDAVDAAEQIGFSLIADFGNMWMERDFRDVLVRANPHLALIQICDVVIGSSGRPAPGGRVHVGEGELPLHRMMRDVLDAGYTGLFDLEVVGPNFSLATEERSIRQGIITASQFLDDCGV